MKLTMNDLQKVLNKEIKLEAWETEITEFGSCQTTLEYPIENSEYYLRYEMELCWCVFNENGLVSRLADFLGKSNEEEKEEVATVEEAKEVEAEIVETVKIINAEISSSIEATVTVEDIKTGKTLTFRTANIDDYGYTVIPYDKNESDFRTRAIELLKRKPVINSEFYCS